MQILYFIGNGFDRNLGLETSYEQFYSHYKKIKSENLNVQALKKEIKNPSEIWADLETALGKYTINLDDLNQLDDIIINIKAELGKYLISEEKKLDNVSFDLKLLHSYLSSPQNRFLLDDKVELNNLFQRWANHQWDVDLVTFNYTKTIEKLLDNSIENVQIGVHHKQVAIKLRELMHIHGYIDREMVLGVNDKEQIDNTSFQDNQDAIEAIVKPNCNIANKNGIDKKLSDKLNRANLICIFGCSLGKTDAKWWELIGKRLKEDCLLLLFKRGNEINLQNLNLIGRQERAEKEKFLSMTNLTEEEKTTVRSKIYVGINTNMFSKLIVGKTK
ncbi:AbiH family protein [Patiriisocius sp. Uisw_017]|uniref:AbiH family protein n=1 Tax=Patiriisocius sp. Uisw_017 TaxID=3230968 RepID=UPI0039E7CBA3